MIFSLRHKDGWEDVSLTERELRLLNEAVVPEFPTFYSFGLQATLEEVLLMVDLVNQNTESQHI